MPDTSQPVQVPEEWLLAAAAAMINDGRDRLADFGNDELELITDALAAVIPLAKAAERARIAADLRAEGERERERLREVKGLPPGEDPCHVIDALNNWITAWEAAARFVEGDADGPGLIIRNEPGGGGHA